MIIAELNTCYNIIYKKCFNVIICEEIQNIVTKQLSIYAGKNHVHL